MKINTNKKYPSKVLLFGEHSVLKGSSALASPLPQFYGKWDYEANKKIAQEKQLDLFDFGIYLKKEFESNFKLNEFQAELNKGLYFNSNVPQGYGAGSSGTVCAGIYDCFFQEKKSEPKDLKIIFSRMESYFHGKSSGFDPIVCYLNKSILIQNGELKTLKDFTPATGLFLIDTKIPRSTGPLVQKFLENCEDKNYLSRLEKEYIPLVDKSIQAYIQGDTETLFHYFHDISRYQYLYFKDQIPPSFLPQWEDGLKSPNHKIKICGAGGGGFLLGMTKDLRKMEKGLDLILL